MSEPGKVCSKCRRQPRVSGQRWCLDCRAAWKRDRRASQNGAANGPRQNLGERRTTHGQNGADWRPPTPPVDLQPLPSVADKWDGWRGVYLHHLVATGQRIKGCAIAGISRRELQAALDVDPDFREAVDTALGEYADGLAVGLVETGRRRENPVGTIVALKALRPLEYIERSASLSVSADLTQRSPITEAAAVELLKDMLANTTPTTRRILAGAPLEDTPKPETA
jgi:hypothetical protein